jgi:hypothetical protein
MSTYDLKFDIPAFDILDFGKNAQRRSSHGKLLEVAGQPALKEEDERTDVSSS